ncbi:inositol monophosphatase family protein [Natrarchaeobius chitinivorans]|uniref:fructose-bisphosphatase n=1 Tax=Natrarchaeobius chitinivorans TaxID=1679083 RepID=A0A3N6N9D6_NATCH|nr:inositol monophosphatase family protein [Natrarchaeobius chitinivorans]RQG95142.1 inositol monophosphatase [Natrarchaeobius chitinivorans]
MAPPLSELEATAIEACTAGGNYLREAYRSGETDAERLDHDVKSSADTASERRLLEVVRSRFPDHRIDAEESGIHDGDGGAYEWIVDPLDGTNNFESGLPSFATAVTVLEAGEPVLGVAYVPMLDDLYVGTRGEGVRYNGRPVSGGDERSGHDERNVNPSTATVVSVIGHDVKRRPEHAAISESINRALESRCKRRLESWSPTVHWGLLARGRLDGIVCYRPDREEQLLGELFAAESGLETDAGEDWFVGACSRELLAGLRTDVTEAIDAGGQ